MLMLTSIISVLAQQAQAAPRKVDDALQLRFGMIRAFCNASNVGVWPQATSALPCQLMQKRKDLMSGSTNSETAKAEASKAMKDELSKADKAKLSAGKQLVYESVCAKGTQFARWKMCHNPDVAKFMLGAKAAAAMAHANASAHQV